MTLSRYLIAPRPNVEFLRKMLGSLITSTFGIEASRQHLDHLGHLGHRDIRTTSSHYVEKKKRVETTFQFQPRPLCTLPASL